MSRNADVSYTSVEKTLKDSDSFVNFAESIRGIHGGERYANSVAKLTVLEALKTGNVDDDPLENIFQYISVFYIAKSSGCLNLCYFFRQ
jgi:hypothetical protein